MTTKKKAAHTPGPWNGARSSGGQGIIISEKYGENVGVCYNEDDRHLIAAAPDLLAVLKEALENNDDAWKNRARAAIAKAEGREG